MHRQGYLHGHKEVKTEDPLLHQFLLRTSLKKVACKNEGVDSKYCYLPNLEFQQPYKKLLLHETGL